MHWSLLAASLFFVPVVHADSIAKELGRAAGDFGAGVGERVHQGLLAQQPHWVTVPPRSKSECIKESRGELNPVYARCINGYQEFVRVDANGRRYVLQERLIPSHMPR